MFLVKAGPIEGQLRLIFKPAYQIFLLILEGIVNVYDITVSVGHVIDAAQQVIGLHLFHALGFLVPGLALFLLQLLQLQDVFGPLLVRVPPCLDTCR